MRIGASQLAIQISLINNFKKTLIQEAILTSLHPTNDLLR